MTDYRVKRRRTLDTPNDALKGTIGARRPLNRPTTHTHTRQAVSVDPRVEEL